MLQSGPTGSRAPGQRSRHAPCVLYPAPQLWCSHPDGRRLPLRKAPAFHPIPLCVVSDGRRLLPSGLSEERAGPAPPGPGDLSPLQAAKAPTTRVRRPGQQRRPPGEATWDSALRPRWSWGQRPSGAIGCTVRGREEALSDGSWVWEEPTQNPCFFPCRSADWVNWQLIEAIGYLVSFHPRC